MPTLYITGNGPDGRSRVTETKPMDVDTLPLQPYVADGPVPAIVSSTTGAKLLVQHHQPGVFRSSVFAWKPGMHTDMHRTISIDLDIVLEGSVVMLLEAEEVVLRQGDCAFLPGTVHAWRATDEVGIVMYAIVSAAPSEADAAETAVASSTIIHGREQ